MSVKQSNNVQNSDAPLNIKFPVYLDNVLKYATGLTRKTTIVDVISAMVSVLNVKDKEAKNYILVEQWQGNERLIPFDIKVYKLVKLWKSLPGDQWSQVKFVIKKIPSVRHVRFADEVKVPAPTPKKYVFCTLSPAMQKSWDLERVKRKSSFVQKELLLTTQNGLKYEVNSSSESECEEECNEKKRYASIKKFNRVKNSNIREVNPATAKKSINFSSSTLTSVSSIDSSVYKFGLDNFRKSQISLDSCNDSDTGISSASSDELNCQQLETLV